jgi:hypothetical protein
MFFTILAMVYAYLIVLIHTLFLSFFFFLSTFLTPSLTYFHFLFLFFILPALAPLLPQNHSGWLRAWGSEETVRSRRVP